MAWAKAPLAIGSVACAACLAITTALPSSAPAAEKQVGPTQAAVNLAVNWGNLANFDAIPLYLALIGGTDEERTEALAGIDSISGLAAFLALANGGGVESFDDYDALSGLSSIVTGNIGGIDAFSALNATGPGDLDSVNGIPSFLAFAESGDLHSFDQNDKQPGYAALSALGTYQDIAGGNLSTVGNLDSLSAVPVFVGTDPDTGEGTGLFNGGGLGALRGYDALSAIPEYLGIPEPEEEEGPPPGDQNPPALLRTTSLAASEEVTTPADTGTPDVKSGSNNKQNVKRDSVKVSPVGLPVLFGSGKGGAADNGIAGWGAALKSIGLNGGPDPAPAKPADGGGDPGGAAGGAGAGGNGAK
jgi:hypothetical protein